MMAYTSNCLLDYIGLLGCGTTTPHSGLYVNQLAGISLKSVDNTADSEQVTFAGVWSDVQARASRKLFTDLRSELSKRYILKNISNAVDIGNDIDTSITTANAAKYRGLFIDLDGYNDPNHYVKSNWQQINVQKIRLYLSAAINTTIKIFDARSGEQLFTSALTSAIGWNDVNVYQKFTARKIFVAYDSTNITSVNLDIDNIGCCETDCGAWLYGGHSNIATTVKESDITKANDSFGISVYFDVQCNYDALVCYHKEIFTNAYWYLLGSELLLELQHSPRINFYTTINAQKAKELKEAYKSIYKDELMHAVAGLNLNTTDCCLECNNQVIIREVMP